MKNKKKKIINFLSLNVGIILVATAVALFLNRYNMAAGGLSGLAIIIRGVFDINITIFITIANIFLITISYFLLGKKFFLKTAYGALVYPFYLQLELFIISKMTIPDVDMFLVVIFAALIMGTGMAIAYRSGGSTGGGDIIQAIFLKYFNIPYSKTMYIIDGTVILAGFFVFGLEPGLCSVIFMVLTGYVVDTVTFGGYNKRSVFVITKKHDEVATYIMKNLVRGVTDIQAYGGYTKMEKRLIFCILSTTEYFQLRAYVEKIDHEAFLVAQKATEVRGYGFSLEFDRKKKEGNK